MLTQVQILVSALSVASLAAATCFFPDGVTVPVDYKACLPNNAASVCCYSDDYCTTTGFCLSVGNGYHYRGGCTDKSWSSPSCPQSCLANTNGMICKTDDARIRTNASDLSLGGNSSFVNIIACNANQDGGSWCCAYEGNCCSSTTFTPSWGGLFAVSSNPSSTANSGTSATTTTTATVTTAAKASSTNATAIAVGISLAAVLLLTLIASGIMFFQFRKGAMMAQGTKNSKVNGGKPIKDHTQGDVYLAGYGQHRQGLTTAPTEYRNPRWELDAVGHRPELSS